MLKRWKWGSLALILALACFSLKSLKGITQEWRKESERALFGLGLSSARQSGKRGGWKGMEGVYILFSLKRAVGWRGTWRLRVYARRLRATLGFQTLNRAQKLRASIFSYSKQGIRRLRATGSGVSGPIPGVSRFGRIKLRFCSFEWCLWFTYVFLGSLEHMF